MSRRYPIPSPKAYPPVISQLVRSCRRARILLAAVEREIFDALEVGRSGRSAGEVARALRLDERGTEIVLNALAAMEFVNKKKNRFRNTPFSGKYLVRTSPDNVVGSLVHGNAGYKGWAKLDDVLVTGKPQWFGEPEEDEEYFDAVFTASMYAGGYGQAMQFAGIVDLSGAKSLIDIGGSSGVFSYFLCRKHKRLVATVFDLPSVIKETRRYFKKFAMGKRMKAIAGDFTVDGIPGKYDAAMVSQIIHAEGEKENRRLMKKVYGCLNDRGVIIVRDFLLDESRTRPEGAAMFAVNMLVNTTAGRSYTRGEVTRWLREAGFKNIRLAAPPDKGGVSVLTARKG